MTYVKQSSYYLLMIIIVLLSVSGAIAVFFFGVGYIHQAVLLLAMLVSYLGIAIKLIYLISHFYQPTSRQLLMGTIVLLLFAIFVGVAIGALLVG
jgi:hypothetical protein